MDESKDPTLEAQPRAQLDPEGEPNVPDLIPPKAEDPPDVPKAGATPAPLPKAPPLAPTNEAGSGVKNMA